MSESDDHTHERAYYLTIQWPEPRKNKTTRTWHCQCGAQEVPHHLGGHNTSTVWVPSEVLDQMEAAH